MSTFLPGVPETGEYNPAFAGYVSKAKSFADPVEQMGRQLDQVLGVLRTLTPEKRLYRYAPGKWSIQELLGHVIDTERIFAYRALCVARGDQTPLPGFEENDYAVAAQSERCEFGELLEELEHVRRASVLLFRHLPESAWVRRGTVNGAATTVRAIAYIMIGHAEHHLDVLRDKYL